MKVNLFILAAAAAACLGGCTLAPEYKRPPAPVAGAWPEGGAYGHAAISADAPAAPALKWQEFVTDEKLRRVIETALNKNRDLRLAALNVERARAMYGIQRASLLPTVNATGGMAKQRLPADLAAGGNATTTQRYDVNLGISAWEIDFFGRMESLKERALEEYLATDAARASAQMMLVSAVAEAYLALAADRGNGALARSTLKTQEDSLRLIRKRYEVGLASALDLQRAQGQVEAARVEAARWSQLAAQEENALTLLMGAPLPTDLAPADLDDVAAPREISPGLSSAVLLERPDVLMAEHQLKAANANIGAARAAFFPRISLTTSLGTASADLSGLFKAGQSTWSFAPQIAIPIFDARTWSAYDVTKAEKEISLAQYEKSVQTAFREVADALAARSAVNQQLDAQQSMVRAAGETFRLAGVRYEKGIDGYLSVLDAQRSLYTAQQGLVTLRLARLVNQVRLYKVLGGGR